MLMSILFLLLFSDANRKIFCYLIVNGDTIGPADTDIDQNSPLGSIQTRPFNAGILAPLCPEQVATRTNTQKHNRAQGHFHTNQYWDKLQK